MARVSTMLGAPPMGWQLTASDLLGEHDGAGRRVHGLCVVSTQRQVGKTTWVLGEAVDRCLFTRGARVWYTAQNGNYARDRWGELVETLMGSPLRRFLRVRRSNGAERLQFLPTGSLLRPFPPTRDALHGEQSDLVVVDECWRFDDDQGEALMQAIGPTQATRPGAQVLLVSTQGTDLSTFLNPLVDRGRSGDPAVTYLEYGIGDDVDPLDVDAVAAAHPAVGRTIDKAFLMAEAARLADRPGAFARAYGNRRTATLERVIPAAVWLAAATPRTLPAGAVTYAGAVALDRSRGAIVAIRESVAEVIRSAPGVDWMVPALQQLARRRDCATVAVLRQGPDGPLADELELSGVAVSTPTSTDYAIACARTLDDLTHGRLRYRLHPALDAAAEAAAQRNVGDGWVWAPRRSTAPIPELVALTVGHWADTHVPDPRKPVARG